MGSNAYIHVCLTETCSIYRLGISRLGVCHVADGLISVLTGAGLMWLNQGTIWSGIGVWTGLPIMLTGVVCLLSRQKKSRGKISAVTLMCILSMAVSGFLFSTSAYNINRVLISSNITDHFPRYHLQDTAPLVICNSLLVTFGLLEFIISIWSSALSVGVVCLCWNIGRERVFTIPYEGMENEGPQGPDIVAAHPPPPNVASSVMDELDDSGLPHFPGPDSSGWNRGARNRGSSSAPPVLHIDMDLEWDEMTMPIGGEEMNTADFVNPPGRGNTNIARGKW